MKPLKLVTQKKELLQQRAKEQKEYDHLFSQIFDIPKHLVKEKSKMVCEEKPKMVSNVNISDAEEFEKTLSAEMVDTPRTPPQTPKARPDISKQSKRKAKVTPKRSKRIRNIQLVE